MKKTLTLLFFGALTASTTVAEDLNYDGYIPSSISPNGGGNSITVMNATEGTGKKVQGGYIAVYSGETETLKGGGNVINIIDSTAVGIVQGSYVLDGIAVGAIGGQNTITISNSSVAEVSGGYVLSELSVDVTGNMIILEGNTQVQTLVGGEGGAYRPWADPVIDITTGHTLKLKDFEGSITSSVTNFSAFAFEQSTWDVSGTILDLTGVTHDLSGIDITFDLSPELIESVTPQTTMTLIAGLSSQDAIADLDTLNEKMGEDFELSWSGEEEAWNLVVEKVSGTIPEPSTATLSLLALAGLAARRRRK